MTTPKKSDQLSPYAASSRAMAKELLLRFTPWLTIIWIFIVPIIILAMMAMAFLILPMGRDVVVVSNEKEWSMLFANMTTLLIAYVLWYLPRLLAYTHDKLLKEHPHLRRHLPRFFAATSFNIMLLAQMHSGAYGWDITSDAAIGLLLLVGPLWYMLLQRIAKAIREVTRTRRQKLYYNITILVMLGGIALSSYVQSTVALLYLAASQLAFQVVIECHRSWSHATVVGTRIFQWLARRQLMRRIEHAFSPFIMRFKDENKSLLSNIESRWKQVPGYDFNLARETTFYGFFLLMSFILFAAFIGAVLSPDFAVRVGSLGVVLMGLATVLALFVTCQIIQRVSKVSVLALLAMVSLGSSFFGEPHDIDLVPSPTGQENPLERRPDFDQYLYKWYKEREPLLASLDANETYPMYYVLADGGASRSGYWVATVLGRLDSLSRGCFQKHLFCLSGASGGSVGTGTYYALLNSEVPARSREHQGRRILSNDLLSFPMARMLSTDILNLLFPPVAIADRAQALDASLERAAALNEFDSLFHRSFAQLCADSTGLRHRRIASTFLGASTAGDTSLLPLLFINATRMQDGKPAVISTIRLDQTLFNARIDILDLLPGDRDMKLSTAMITGARFPYISPAGRITRRNGDHQEEHYFVDGGYFDNSGAGVALEMIQRIEQMKLDSPASMPYLKRLEPYVFHISNSPQSAPELRSVSPVVNDLAAPVKTLIGAYGMQTDINDMRLLNYLGRVYGGSTHYYDIALYRSGAEHESYPMNWVISERMRRQMDKRLIEHPLVAELGEWLRRICVREEALLSLLDSTKGVVPNNVELPKPAGQAIKLPPSILRPALRDSVSQRRKMEKRMLQRAL
jgi:hypothetical protein